MSKIVPDHKIREMQQKYKDDRDLVDMLYDYKHVRRMIRAASAEKYHDARYPSGVTSLNVPIRLWGCEWWMCEEQGDILRVRAESHSREDPIYLCKAHETEGDEKGLWIPKAEDRLRRYRND